MGALAGWFGHAEVAGQAVLTRLGEVLSGPVPVVSRYLDATLAIVTTAPRAAEPVARLAQSPDGLVTIAMAGNLFTEDDEQRRHPAADALARYLAEGPTFAASLNGSFGFVICDRRRGELHLVTDRLGTRPLFYRRGEPFLFGSQVRAVLEFPGVEHEANEAALLAVLLREHLLDGRTYYDAIERAPAASVTTWDGRRIRSTRYWTPAAEAADGGDLEEHAERARLALEGATRRACAGASRPALMLSGGLDSRSIAAACETPLLCLTLHRQYGQEALTARRVARVLGHEHVLVIPPQTYPLESGPAASLLGDGLHAFPHAQGLYLTDTMADEGVDAVINGTMLEEVFGCPQPVPPPNGEPATLAAALTRIRSLASQPEVQALVEPQRLAQAGACLEDAAARLVAPYEELPRTFRARYQATLLGAMGSAPGMLNWRCLDGFARAHLLACDTAILDLCDTVPTAYRATRALYYGLHVHLDRRCRWIPNQNTGMPVTPWPRVDDLGRFQRRVLNKLCYEAGRRLRWVGLVGYPTTWPPEAPNLPAWRHYLATRVAQSQLVARGAFRAPALRSMVDEFIAGRRRHWRLITRWLTLEEWLAVYG